MTTIKLVTVINASVEKCFNVSRDIQIHELSAKGTNEKAIAGKISGLCELNDEITWQAKHFGIRQKLTVKISKIDPPSFFEDIMLKGAFKSMRHEHHFKKINDNTYQVESSVFSKDVYLYDENSLAIFDDNFFDLEVGQKKIVKVKTKNASNLPLKIKSLVLNNL